jgi:hypothetical protein
MQLPPVVKKVPKSGSWFIMKHTANSDDKLPVTIADCLGLNQAQELQ